MTKPQVAKEKLLDAAWSLIREKGFSATTVDELCSRAGVTKGAFFHYFKSKEALGVMAAERWSTVTGSLFEQAAYHRPEDPVDRILAYVAFRKKLIAGPISEFTCVAGTMLQETHKSTPAIQAACAASILGHACTLEDDFAAALASVGRTSPSAKSLALHTQTVIQGAFVVAKATGRAETAQDAIEHLGRYIRLLLGRERVQETT